MCEYSALVHDKLRGERWFSVRLAHVRSGGEIKATFDHTEDGCSLAQRSWKRQNRLDFHNKIGGGNAEYSEVEKEKLIHTNISPMIIQRCNWKEERKNQKVQTAAPGRGKRNPTKIKVKQQKKQKR